MQSIGIGIRQEGMDPIVEASISVSILERPRGHHRPYGPRWVSHHRPTAILIRIFFIGEAVLVVSARVGCVSPGSCRPFRRRLQAIGEAVIIGIRLERIAFAGVDATVAIQILNAIRESVIIGVRNGRVCFVSLSYAVPIPILRAIGEPVCIRIV